MRASSASGGSGLLQCSQFGLISSIASPSRSSSFHEALGALALQEFYDVGRRRLGRREPAFSVILAEHRAGGKCLERHLARYALHLGIDHAGLIAIDGDIALGLRGK